MNKRIKELSEQAAKGEGCGMEVWQTTYSEKFAELIIRECLEAVFDAGPDPEYYQNRIKKHFGVTE